MADYSDSKQPKTTDELTQVVSPASIDLNTIDVDRSLLNDTPVYRVYKRRFFGLAQLILLNIVISWNWLTFAPVSDLSAQWFDVSESVVNWMSTAFLFAFVAMTPITLLLLNKGGPAQAIRYASILVLIGSWVRYGGSRSGSFGAAMFGQIIIGLAQPLVLSSPTRYSNLWFSDKGRVTATAVASLANPLGGALGQLIGPIWADNATQIPEMVVWTSTISTVVAVIGFLTPSAPPTPPSRTAAAEKLDLIHGLRALSKNTVFFLLAIPFVVYVGLFNAISSLLNQIFQPYGFSDDDAGIGGAILIVAGLVAAAVASPIIDRTRLFLLAIRLLVPILAVIYVALIFMPQTQDLPGSWIVLAALGAASFSLLPCALEYLAIVTHPVSPEISSTICWSLAQLSGAIFILIMDALKAGRQADPSYNMYNALVFQACIACIAVPSTMMIGFWGWTSAVSAPAEEEM
ncbi:hypothetical protein AMS68_004216 [Peltaster fructicola]|uniref:Major facilitator superfamily (MFS) profile domain-containing protein n=1 Tax=Peltaster fructicola TaxID=286661 RepID=A0A6H0XVQ5_9PEZI|nr:hypothetical protein AMS68_004216 [Peltaster fructicola]